MRHAYPKGRVAAYKACATVMLVSLALSMSCVIALLAELFS